MPFGLQKAGATFQRMVDTLLRGAEYYSGAYMEDIGVSSMTWNDHLTHLRDIFLRLQKAGLPVRPTKCRFGARSTPHLGHVNGEGFIRPSQRKVAAILEMPQPRTKAEMRSFLGLSCYY